MRDKFIFQVRTLTIEDGVELSCEGIEEKPLGPMRLIDAVIHATQIAGILPATIEIFDGAGELVETIELNAPGLIHRYLTCLAA